MYAPSIRRLCRFLLFLAFVLLGKSILMAADGREDREGGQFPWHSLRLPQTLFPLNYNIILQTDLKLFQVKGSVSIRVKCAKTTANVILHLMDMNVTKTAVFEMKQQQDDVSVPVEVKDVKYDEEFIERKEKRSGGRELHVLRTMRNTTLELFLIEVNENLVPQQSYEIYIEFEYPLTDKLVGFYRSSYTTESGEKRYLAATLFEPTSARLAFPCFDEPAMKATFTVTIIRQGQYKALSNMPIDKTVKIGDDLYADHFEESVKMSTYLLAFLVICDFKYKETNTASGIKVRMWAPQSQIAQGTYALDIAVRTLSYYEKFFKINFPLPKQDLVAIPDFGTGAEENWGLIGFSTAMVLFDPGKTSDSLKQDVCETVTHELAHQWFGNLVTMKWWNDLWLNEGFATYMESIASDFVEPHWNMLDQFILDKLQTAFSDDQSSFSHPISVEVKDPKEIDNIFDAISYEKGASVIRMLKHFLGSEIFTSGLQSYLKKFAYGNAVTDDLWDCMSEKSGINVKKVMDTWTLQMGLPVVSISRLDQEKATADQKLFLIVPGAKPNQSSPLDYTWHIPLTYITQTNNKSVQVWMNRGPATLSWASTSGWIKVNVDQIGYYRVNYEKENWRALYYQLQSDHKALSSADRSGLIDDAFHLARSDQLDQTIALDLTEYIIHETDYAPLKTFINNMNYIGTNLALRKSYGMFKRYMLQQLHPEIERLGWEDKGSHLDKFLRPAILFTASDCSDQTVISRIKRMFQLAMEGHNIPAYLRSLVYSIGVREGGVEEWNLVYDRYTTTRIASERHNLLFALSFSRNPQMVERCLNYSLDTEKIRRQDALEVISGVASEPKSWRMAWNFVRHNWEILYKRYSRGNDLWPQLITSLTVNCNTKVQLKEIVEFFKDYSPKEAAYRQVQMGIEQIRANILWLSQHEVEVATWLTQHVKI